MKKITFFLLFALSAIGSLCPQSVFANDQVMTLRAKAKKLEKRNKFLNTKYSRSSSAPIYFYEKIRRQTND